MKSVLIKLYRSWLLRISILLVLSLYLAYNYVALPWVNRAIGDTYFQVTGHHLQYNPLRLTLFSCKADVQQLKDSTHLWQLDNLSVDVNCRESWRERALVINSISLNHLSLTATQDEAGRWSFNDIIDHQKQRNSEQTKTNKSDVVPLVIKEIDIKSAKVLTNAHLLDNLPVSIYPLDLSLSHLDLRTKKPFDMNLSSTINGDVLFAAKGKVNASTLDADLTISATKIPFIWFNTLIKPYVTLDILAGTIDTQTQVSITAGTPKIMQISGKLADFKLRPTTMEQDAVKWKAVEWSDAKIDFTQQTAYVPLVTVTNFDSQFIIGKDRKTNVQAMLVNRDGSASAATKNTEATQEQAPKKWQFLVDRLAVQNAAIGFNDQSLSPSFTAIVQQFSGNIIDISNDEQKTMQIHLAGNVDGYAPVNLDGSAKLFIEQPQLKTLFSFKHMDMGAFTSYSAEYAGWRIKKGLLSVDLDYYYDKGKILGKNHVVIDHLEFGEKVRSPHLIDIPLRLGLSLLTDEKGVAVLDAELSGDPKDPSFNIRKMIWRALGNTVKKIISAPFRFLSHLVNTTEDLGRIQFVAGESQLTEVGIKKINLLHEALKKRPNMKLSIQGFNDFKADTLALQEEQVKSALQKQGVPVVAFTHREEPWAQGVGAYYQAQGFMDMTLSLDDKYRALIAKESVSVERLQKLAHERAQAVKQYFVLTLGVASELLLLNTEEICDAPTKCTASDVVFRLEE